ncbi:MAG: transcriptional regulator NrdR [Litorivicinus sp.]
MRCPFCANPETKVIDSRLIADGSQVKRRRACLECEVRFTTFETVEISMPKIVKSNKARESFDENKIRRGIDRALEKRPVSSEQVEMVIDRIKRRIQATSDREVDTNRLGEIVMSELKMLDPVAYVRFASVYKSFQDVTEFVSAVNEANE